MQYIVEKSLKHFEPWCGARYTHETLISNGDIYSVEEMIEEWFEKTPTETEINDLLWFETDLIAEWLGFKNWEEYTEYRDKHPFKD